METHLQAAIDLAGKLASYGTLDSIIDLDIILFCVLAAMSSWPSSLRDVRSDDVCFCVCVYEGER